LSFFSLGSTTKSKTQDEASHLRNNKLPILFAKTTLLHATAPCGNEMSSRPLGFRQLIGAVNSKIRLLAGAARRPPTTKARTFRDFAIFIVSLKNNTITKKISQVLGRS